MKEYMNREDCRFAILQFLYTKQQASYEDIMKEVHAARRMKNERLGELYKDGLVVKEYGKRGKYYLTPQGKIEAEEQSDIRRINIRLEKATPEEIKELRVQLEAAKRILQPIYEQQKKELQWSKNVQGTVENLIVNPQARKQAHEWFKGGSLRIFHDREGSVDRIAETSLNPSTLKETAKDLRDRIEQLNLRMLGYRNS